MNNTPIAYTPQQVAAMLQISKNTVYNLISRGEIIAKRIGKVYRIPQTSISFLLTGLDWNLYLAEQDDLKNIKNVKAQITKVREKL